MYVIDVAGLEEDAQDLIFARVVTKLREHLEKRERVVSAAERAEGFGLAEDRLGTKRRFRLCRDPGVKRECFRPAVETRERLRFPEKGRDRVR